MFLMHTQKSDSMSHHIKVPISPWILCLTTWFFYWHVALMYYFHPYPQCLPLFVFLHELFNKQSKSTKHWITFLNCCMLLHHYPLGRSDDLQPYPDVNICEVEGAIILLMDGGGDTLWVVLQLGQHGHHVGRCRCSDLETWCLLRSYILLEVVEDSMLLRVHELPEINWTMPTVDEHGCQSQHIFNSDSISIKYPLPLPSLHSLLMANPSHIQSILIIKGNFQHWAYSIPQVSIVHHFSKKC